MEREPNWLDLFYAWREKAHKRKQKNRKERFDESCICHFQRRIDQSQRVQLAAVQGFLLVLGQRRTLQMSSEGENATSLLF